MDRTGWHTKTSVLWVEAKPNLASFILTAMLVAASPTTVGLIRARLQGWNELS